MTEAILPQYSTLFTTIYDEPQPVGDFGRGIHYSVLRATTSYDHELTLSGNVCIHDFSIIWDEDHDFRVIEVIEKLCIQNLLSPAVFIGERKAGLSIIVDSRFHNNPQKLSALESSAQNICDSLIDNWLCEVGYFNPADPESEIETTFLTNAPGYKINTYLRNIHNLWSLGVKKYTPENLM